MLTIGAENQKGERVSQDPLERPADYHKQTAHEIVHPSRSRTITARAAPAHDVAREGRQGHDETEQRQRCGIAKRLSQVAFDLVLGREVDLLEELGGYGDGAAPLNALERGVGVDGLVEEWSTAIAVQGVGAGGGGGLRGRGVGS